MGEATSLCSDVLQISVREIVEEEIDCGEDEFILDEIIHRDVVVGR